jgi:site-specific DNA recombinase
VKRAVIVARVSTDQQAERGRSIQTQHEQSRRYAEALGYEIVAEIKDDISGTVPLRERPGGQRLYELIDQHEVDAVIFHSVDRVTRDEDLLEINLLRRDVRNAGIELHYSNDGGKTDLSTWGGVIDTLKAAGAAEERKKIQERTQRAKRDKAARGQWVGTGHVAYGYRGEGKKKEARLVIDWTEAATVRRIFALYLGSESATPMTALAIAELLTREGVRPPNRGKVGKGWYVSKITAMLRNRNYIGEFKCYGSTLHFPDIAIIDRATFDLAQLRVESNRNSYRTNRTGNYLLTGFLRCTCNKAMCGHKSGYTAYYVCTWRRRARYMSTCREKSVRLSTADAVVWAWIKSIVLNPERLTETLTRMSERVDDEIQPKRERLAQVDTDIVRARTRVDRLMAAFGGEDDAFVAASLESQIAQVKANHTTLQRERDMLIAEIGQGEVTRQQKTDILETATQLREIIETADFEEQRFILERLNFDARLEQTEDGYALDCKCVFTGERLLLMGSFGSSCAGTRWLRECVQARRSRPRRAQHPGQSRHAEPSHNGADRETTCSSPPASHARECA